jgi:predicted lysophospholipase L1 biosynthesis ABC-type transport system permease subunit
MAGPVEDAAVETVHEAVHTQAVRRSGTIHERNSSDGGLMLSCLSRVLLVILLAVTMAGCSAIAGIFKAGFWVGLIVAALVVIGIFTLMGRRG